MSTVRTRTTTVIVVICTALLVLTPGSATAKPPPSTGTVTTLTLAQVQDHQFLADGWYVQAYTNPADRNTYRLDVSRVPFDQGPPTYPGKCTSAAGGMQSNIGPLTRELEAGHWYARQVAWTGTAKQSAAKCAAGVPPEIGGATVLLQIAQDGSGGWVVVT